MKDILRPILELLVVLPGLLLGYFPVKTYLKQSPGRLAAWLFPLMACLCIGSWISWRPISGAAPDIGESPLPPSRSSVAVTSQSALAIGKMR